MDAKTTALVQTYAKAFVELLAEKNQLEETRRDVETLLEVFSTSHVAPFLSDISVPESEKVKIVRLFQESSSSLLNNFLEVILQNDRVALLEAILTNILEQMSELTGVYDVFVSSAVAMSDTQKEKLKKIISSKIGIKVGQLLETVDDSLIGGFVVQANNHIIDTSIKQQLQQIKMKLK